MKIKNSIIALGRGILDLVFPIRCIVCNDEKEKEFLCSTCSEKLKVLEIQNCISCKKPSPFGKTHPTCITRNVVDGIISALPYNDPKIKELIKVFKYKFIASLGERLSLQLSKTITQHGLNSYFQEFVVIPVPLHKKRFSWRGFNQSLILARSVANELGLRLNNEILIRHKNTKPQTTLKGEERKNNILDAFSINEPVEDKKFLLIDDVVTTGSTLNEIAKLLKKEKAQEVWAITLAKD